MLSWSGIQVSIGFGDGPMECNEESTKLNVIASSLEKKIKLTITVTWMQKEMIQTNVKARTGLN